ncbi:hypothetical protein H6796_02895 [Candidatus Nomurabacteria bacterium]|nr:hypothetical protein [Candidatus Nomurabacteria bacterium]
MKPEDVKPQTRSEESPGTSSGSELSSNGVVTSAEDGAKVKKEPYVSPIAARLRPILVKSMLGMVIAAAVVAVIAILAGSMGEIAWKSIGTLFAGMVHIFILLAVVSAVSKGDQRTETSTNIVINTAMIIAIMSFFTSVFSIWDVIDGTLTTKLYATYIVIMTAVLHAKSIFDVVTIYDKVRPYVYANTAFILIVAMLILGIIYLPEGSSLLAGFYGRLLAASVVVDVTLGIVVAVMYKLYVQKHPEMQLEEQTSGGVAGSVARIVVAILILLFVALPLMLFILNLAS